MKFFRKKEANVTDICSKEGRKTANQNMRLLILGSGCSKCTELEKNALTAISQMGLSLSVGHITDFSEIAGYGVMSTPALVLNGKIISCGKVLSAAELKTLLSEKAALCAAKTE